MNEKLIEEMAFRVVGDAGSLFTVTQAHIGDRLGLFRALAGAPPMTSEELAGKTDLNERYVREWAKGMVAGQYIEQDPTSGRFFMTPEQAFVLVDEESPMFVGGLIQFAPLNVHNLPGIIDAFKNGGGVAYDEMDADIPESIERLFAPGYKNALSNTWLAAIPGLIAKLEAGAKVLDVGSGCGQSTVAMAKAFPQSRFVGIDYDRASIERAVTLAAESKVTNIEWMQASAESIPADSGYDLVCSFDCIHDMVNPKAALAAIRASLAPDGAYLWGEPNASHDPLENRNLVGRLFANVSPIHCLSVSLAHGGEGLGTVIGEAGARELAEEAGFSRFEKLPIANPFTQFFALRR